MYVDGKTVYYRKVGDEFVPVSEYDNGLLNSVPNGAHLLVVDYNSTSRRYNIDAAWAPLVAAAYYGEKILVDVIQKELSPKPSKTPLTTEQLKAWENLNQVFGESISLVHPSTADIAQKTMDALSNEAKKMLANPTVAAAYEQFLMTVELARTQGTDK